ncbi:hypothetical protein niasHT_024435 [Heterodera trifolii]|uniref:TOG domain-containing protein n=1 Tax=Heterodera trifolii TaxID=157864 RepID=A0ABD2JY95_9BILA
MDPYDLIEPVDISSKLNINFESPKWQERKEALDALQQLLLQSPRLADSPNYREVMERLAKTMASDANIIVAASATKCVMFFAKGLRAKFTPHVSLVVPAIFDKFKEKKQLLRDALVECIDVIAAHTSFDHLSKALLEAMTAKQNPSQKSQTDLFIYRVFRSLPAKDIPKGLLKDLVAILSKHGSDADSEVRDSSFAALGAIMKCIGEKALGCFISPELAKDANKMAKIAEYQDKAMAEAAVITQNQASAHANDLSGTSSSNQQSDECVTQQNACENEVDPWDLMEPIDISSKLNINFESPKWQERKEALDALQQLLLQSPRLADSPNYREFIERLAKIMANDANIIVAASATKCVMFFAKGLRAKFTPHVSLVVPAIFDKFKEKKQLLRDALVECIDVIAAHTSFDHLSKALLEAMTAKQNPSQKSQTDLFIYRVFRSLSAKDIPKGLLKDLVAILSKHGSDADSEVRDSSFAALGAIMKCIGEKALGCFISPELAKDANKMAKIAENRDKALADSPNTQNDRVELFANPSSRPVADSAKKRDASTSRLNQTINSTADDPNATKKAADQALKQDANDLSDTSYSKQQNECDTHTHKQQTKIENEFVPWELMEPVDISSKLNFNFESPKWQEKKEALDALQQLLSQTPRLADSPNYREVIEHLTKAMANSNFIIAVSAIKCVMYFAKGLRAKFTPHVLLVVPVIFDKFKEKKQLLRDALVECIDVIAAYTSFDHLSKALLEAMTAKQNPSQKSQTDLFIYRVFRSLPAKDIPKGLLKDLVAILSKHGSDADSEVRDSSFAALGAIMKCIGEKALGCFISPELAKDPNKMAKIAENRDKAMADSPNTPNDRVELFANASSRPAADSAKKRDASTSRLNQTINSTADDPNATKRARSASGRRRSVAVLPNNSMINDNTDEGNPRAPRRSHFAGSGGLSSAVSYSSNLNTTMTLQSQNVAGKFQLDPKFFQNDFDDNTLLAGNNRGERELTNTTQTLLLDRTFKVSTPKVGDKHNNTNAAQSMDQASSVDLQPIKPVVRPTSTFSRRSESVSSISSLESAEHIDRTVHNISCLQLNIAEEALAQLLHLMNDHVTRQYIIDRTELILKTMVTQIFHIRSQHLEQLDGVKEGDQKEQELSEFMRSICNFLSTLTNEMTIMQRISTDTLRSFIDALLSLVSDQRLKILNKQVFRSLNIIVIRLCEFTNPNVCFVALMKLVMKYQASDPGGQLSSLVRKCLTKFTDAIVEPTRIEKVDILTVLHPIHEYYSRFYVADGQTNQISDTVKDTSKLLCIFLQRLVINQKYAMLNYLYPFPENSQLVSYVRRCIRTVGRKAMEEKRQDGGTGGTATNQNNQPKIGAGDDELSSIFSRISCDVFNGAVEDLYNFMDIHPDQNSKFEQLMDRCEYASIVRRAFVEIRQTRLNREPLKPGICVRRVLPEETRQFLEEQNALSNRMNELMRLFTPGASPSTANTPSSATAASIIMGTLKNNLTRN